MLEKNLTPLSVAEKILSPVAWEKKNLTKPNHSNTPRLPPPNPPPPPQKSNVRPLRDMTGENRCHICAHESEKALLVSVSKKGIALETGLNNTVNKTYLQLVRYN